MEGGCGGNPPDRRADRLIHDFDLNVKLESDEEMEQEPEHEQLAHNVAPQVIHGLEEGSPGVDVISDNSKVEEQQNQMVPRVRILGYGGINVPQRVGKKESNAGAKEELTGPVRKRARTSRTGTIGPMGSPGEASSSSAEKSAKAKKRSGTLKIRRKSLDKEGNTEIQPPSPVEERKP